MLFIITSFALVSFGGTIYSSVSRFVYFYETGGLMRLIFSGRDVFLVEHIERFGGYYNVVDVVFGRPCLATGSGKCKLVEMDFFDIFFLSGLWGGAIVIVALILIFKEIKIHSVFASTECLYMICFVNVMLLVAAVLSGHVVFSGTLSLFWAMCCASVYYFRKSGDV